jgi:uncharacterized delta-60 repeat protein
LRRSVEFARIVVVGVKIDAPCLGCWEFAVGRYDAAFGSPDLGFGSEGAAFVDFGGKPHASASAVALQPDGKIVVVGQTWTVDGGFGVVRFDANGGLDSTFGFSGRVRIGFGTITDAANAVALQADGKIVVAGVGGSSADFALARLISDGSLDPSFGSGGKVTTDFGGVDGAEGVALQADGKIVAAGRGNGRFALARYNANGTLDTSFNGTGKVTTLFSGQSSSGANALAIEASGRIIAAGSAWVNSRDEFAVARYEQNGALDATFGAGGEVLTSFGASSDDRAQAVAIQTDGKIVVAGGGGPCAWPGCQVELARYLGDAVDTTPSFGDPVNYPAHLAPQSVAIGQLNGDSKPDLAVANGGSDDVSVLLGNGDGTFKPALNYPAAGGPHSVAIGDLNGDGTRDLAVADRVSDAVSILLGNGDGTFRSAVSYDAHRAPWSVAIGDLNADRKPDLVVANALSDDVSVLLGNGDGTFRSAVSYGAHRYPYSVAIGDLNGDGNPDLAVANFFPSVVSILLGNGDGTFRTAVSYDCHSSPVSVAIGDLNGDGNPDLAVANINSQDVSVLLGNGDGSFRSAVNYYVPGSGAPFSVAIGDLNADGKPDLAVAAGGPDRDQVSILLGNGDGSFQSAVLTYRAYNDPESVAIGDLNADGKPDLAVSNLVSGDVSVLLQSPSAAPRHLTITSSTANLASGSSRVLTAEIRSANGSVVTSDNLTVVTFSQTSGSGSVTGLGSVIASNGIASKTVTGKRTGPVTITASAAGLTSATTTFTVVDTTAPTITVPAPITVPATSPTGAVVSYVVTATDPDDAATVSCAPPSATIFPIGTTTVTCTGVDTHGNSAQASFTVHVQGAAEQLHDLALAVSRIGPGTSLSAKVEQAQRRLSAGDLRGVCATLAAFAHEAQAQSGKSIPSIQAGRLITAAQRIRAVLSR